MLALKRALAACFVFAVSALASESVEFNYYAYPRQYWERELVFLKNIGVRSVSFSIPSDWQQNASSPRGDLLAFVKLLRRLDLSALVPEAARYPALAPFLQSHGGPLMDAAPNAARVSAVSAGALAKSRDILSGTHTPVLWTEVEDSISPEFSKGAISLSGEELPGLAAVRRDASLLQYWGALIDTMTPRDAQPMGGHLPQGVQARQLFSPEPNGPSAVSIVNSTAALWQGELRVFYPSLKRAIALPGITVPAGEALWLPINLPLAPGPLCRNCTALAATDHIIYATAELTDVEFENGILSLEFAAPTAGEVLLQLSREPSGPLLAAGTPAHFDWDAAASRARLPIPQGKGVTHRVRIGLAIEPPETSAFFTDAKILIAGQKNRISTSYSSEEVAKHSRLVVPPEYRAEPVIKTPNEIDYLIDVPANALHGDHVEFVLESDGMQMSRARLQLLRPASLRVREGASLHFGTEDELPVTPALVPVEDKAGRNISVVIRNNFPEIKNYSLQISSPDLSFSPVTSGISIGPSMERDVSIRVFATDAAPGVHPALLKLSGSASFELPVDFVVIPRGQTVAYSLDLDEDGKPDYILESSRARAVFDSPKGGRWLEFVWKDSGRNVLPAGGIPLSAAKLALTGAELSIERTSPAPEALQPGKQGEVVLDIAHPAPNRAVYSLRAERSE